MSVGEVAERLGVSSQTVVRWTKNFSSPAMRRMKRRIDPMSGHMLFEQASVEAFAQYLLTLKKTKMAGE